MHDEVRPPDGGDYSVTTSRGAKALARVLSQLREEPTAEISEEVWMDFRLAVAEALEQNREEELGGVKSQEAAADRVAEEVWEDEGGG